MWSIRPVYVGKTAPWADNFAMLTLINESYLAAGQEAPKTFGQGLLRNPMAGRATIRDGGKQAGIS
jgi:hypothetical protein